MSQYHNFIGIDIGKFTIVVAEQGSKVIREYENSNEGLAEFINFYKKKLNKSLVVMETTGGCEIKLLLTLCDLGVAVHRAHNVKVKNFIRSYGKGAKTDKLDAQALALYGYERHERLELYKPISPKLLSLYQLVERRKDLRQMIIAEKNRLESPSVGEMVRSMIEGVLKVITAQIEEVTLVIDELISNDEELNKRREILMTVDGIGKIVACELLASMPEMGECNRREIASLAGVAPQANDSGKYHGYRRCKQGRKTVKPILFLAAMAASKSKGNLGRFYQNLIKRGKKRIVAITALMRKIIVIANARIRESLAH